MEAKMSGKSKRKSWQEKLEDSKPKCCIKYDADMLKNLCKTTRFDYDTHDCIFNL